MKRFLPVALFLFAVAASSYAATAITGYVQIDPPTSPQPGGFNTQSGTVGTFTDTGLSAGGCVQATVGGQFTTTGINCGTGGGGVGGGGTINSANQNSIGFYSGVSTTIISGLVPGTSGQVLTTGGSSVSPFWSTPSSGGGGGGSGQIIASPQYQLGQYSGVSTTTITGSPDISAQFGIGVTIDTATVSSMTVTNSFKTQGTTQLNTGTKIDINATGPVTSRLIFSQNGVGISTITQNMFGQATPAPNSGNALIFQNGTSSLWLNGNTTPNGGFGAGGNAGIGSLSNGTTFFVDGSMVVGAPGATLSTGIVATDGLYVYGPTNLASSATVSGQFTAGVGVFNSLTVNGPPNTTGVMISSGTRIEFVNTTNNGFGSYINNSGSGQDILQLFSDQTMNIQASSINIVGFTNMTNTLTQQGGIKTSTIQITGIVSQCLQTDANGNVTGAGATCGSGSGGSSALQITQSGVQITSPTASINFSSAAFTLGSVGSTATVNMASNITYNTVTFTSTGAVNGHVIVGNALNYGTSSPGSGAFETDCNNATSQGNCVQIYSHQGTQTALTAPLVIVQDNPQYNERGIYLLQTGTVTAPVNGMRMDAPQYVTMTLEDTTRNGDGQNGIFQFSDHNNELRLEPRASGTFVNALLIAASTSSNIVSINRDYNVGVSSLEVAGNVTIGLSNEGVNAPLNGLLVQGNILDQSLSANSNICTDGSKNLTTSGCSSGGGAGSSTTTVLINGVILSSPTTSQNYVPGNGMLVTGSVYAPNSVNLNFAADTSVMLSRATDQANTSKSCVSTTGSTTYACNLLPALTIYTTNQCVTLLADTSNTTTATLNVNTLGALPILGPTGSALSAGNITALKPVTVCLSSPTSVGWTIQGGAGGGGSGTITAVVAGPGLSGGGSSGSVTVQASAVSLSSQVVSSLPAASIAAGSLGASVIASSHAVNSVGVAQLNFTGTPTSSTFARGDGTWVSSGSFSGSAVAGGVPTQVQVNVGGVIGATNFETVDASSISFNAISSMTYVGFSSMTFGTGTYLDVSAINVSSMTILSTGTNTSLYIQANGTYGNNNNSGGMVVDCTGGGGNMGNCMTIYSNAGAQGQLSGMLAINTPNASYNEPDIYIQNASTNPQSTIRMDTGWPTLTWKDTTQLAGVGKAQQSEHLGVFRLAEIRNISDSAFDSAILVSSAANFNDVAIGLGYNSATNTQLQVISSTNNVKMVSFSTTTTSSVYGVAVTTANHISFAGVSPSTSSCGTGAGFTGTDANGFITPGTGAGGCTVTFAIPYKNTPTCVVTERTDSLVNALSYTVNSTALVVTQTSLSSIVDYNCSGIRE